MFVSPSKPLPASATLLATIMSRFLSLQFLGGVGGQIFGLGGEADQHLAALCSDRAL